MKVLMKQLDIVESVGNYMREFVVFRELNWAEFNLMRNDLPYRKCHEELNIPFLIQRSINVSQSGHPCLASEIILYPFESLNYIQ